MAVFLLQIANHYVVRKIGHSTIFWWYNLHRRSYLIVAQHRHISDIYSVGVI